MTSGELGGEIPRGDIAGRVWNEGGNQSQSRPPAQPGNNEGSDPRRARFQAARAAFAGNDQAQDDQLGRTRRVVGRRSTPEQGNDPAVGHEDSEHANKPSGFDRVKGFLSRFVPDFSSIGEAIDKNKIGGFLKRQVEGYLNKFDPRDKDKKAWLLGIVGGFSSVIAVAEMGATLGLTPALRAIGATAILQGSNKLYEFLHRGYLKLAIGAGDQTKDFRNEVLAFEQTLVKEKLSKEQVRERYNSDEFRGIILKHLAPGAENWSEMESDPDLLEKANKLHDKLTKLGKDYSTVGSAARSLAAGLMVGSLIGGSAEVGARATLHGGIAEGVLNNDALDVKVQSPVELIPNAEKGTLGITLRSPIELNPPSKVPVIPMVEDVSANLIQKAADIKNSQQFATAIAAEVGKYYSDQAATDMINKAVQAKGLVGLDHLSIDAGKEAVKHFMEQKGNEVFEKALNEAIKANPNADVTTIIDQARASYDAWMVTSASNQIADIAQSAILEHGKAESVLTQGVTKLLNEHSDWYKPTYIQNGDTIGGLYHLGWTPNDAPLLGANLAANFDQISQMSIEMEKFRSGNFFFQISPSEIPDLVDRAKRGDRAALRLLVEAQHWIRSGSTLKIVRADKAMDILNGLKELSMNSSKLLSFGSVTNNLAKAA